ncbi:hypothetical protein RVBP17_1100 [Pseudomonas phage sp. 30-3]|uniref:Head completion nuclease n=1 Tax=Pseudomonas phage vB_PaeM_PA5oct TaxID=2163605 RepID=A0A4Y5JVD2_9CAUD|nr:head closure [Pseudomonas phage vB_PaeM_PA5oct]WMI31744.1 hypothetical protein GBBBJNDB_00041 [Pseudomonas phage Callisto]WPK40227.1 head closure [Pseudomonas phage Ettore]WPK40742.1 head closure [Pseudomonas phage Paride]VOH53688.1 Holliday junction resolvase [Pseudomonas phage vB_PaeM_MIJ3]BDR25847.1 hypothetical protein RVBP16_2870 [Pseudomonas phage sp. 30-2]BDR26067.1 hypothetical protein RVBP17_1100 [Pseudomonas phage sp. 30-3]
MGSYKQGTYIPKNPGKYIGKKLPYYRSAWEYKFMQTVDENMAVIEWASEPISIPYFNPVTNKQSLYVPDFLMVYVDSKGNKHTEIVEIKPRKETFLEHAKTKQDKYRLAMNAAKWQAAAKFCSARGIRFRVINEDHIYRNPK